MSGMLITKGGIALLLLVLVAVFVIPQAGAANFIVIAGLIALFIVNLPLALRMVRGVSVRREHATHVKEGVEMQVTLHVANTSKTPRMLVQVSDMGPGGKGVEPLMVPFIGGCEVLEVNYTCNAMRRGIYEFSSCGLESTAPFGLFGARRKVPASSRMVVYPLYYELPGAVLPFTKTYSGLTAAPGSRSGEGLSFFGLREYRPGDPIRKIHWSSTLRARTLMVKEFEEDIHSSVVILLDTCRDSIVAGRNTTSLETAIRAVASIANHTLSGGHPTALARFDEEFDEPRCDKSAGDLTAILDSLAALKPSRRQAGNLIEASQPLIPKRGNWVVVLLSKDEAAMELLLHARSRGVEAMLLICDQKGQEITEAQRAWFPQMMDLYEQAGITTVFLKPDDDVQAVLCQSFRPIRRLRI
jgi:uncharacterized protein (DUF58 family)